MPCVFNKFAILVVGDRISINVVCLKINGAGWCLCNKYGGLPLIHHEYLSKFLLGYPHGKGAFGH